MWSEKHQVRLGLISTDFPVIMNQNCVYIFLFLMKGTHLSQKMKILWKGTERKIFILILCSYFLYIQSSTYSPQ